MIRSKPPAPSRPRWPLAVGGGLALVGWLALRACSHRAPTPLEGMSPTRTLPATPPSAAGPVPTPAPPGGLRCAEVTPEAFLVGDAPRATGTARDGGAAADAPPDEVEDQLAPFAVELGHGTVFDGGFAAGALRDAEGGTVAMVATLGFDGRGGKLVRLGRSRGDLDPPVVVGLGASLLAVMLEPNAGGRAIKVAKVTGEQVTWGVEVSEGRDESLAVDVAASGERAVLVWDDLTPDEKRSSVKLVSFDTATLRSVTRPRAVSPDREDADTPRLATRPGGYWLAYLVRAEPKKKQEAADPDDKDDATYPAEALENRWVEILPLDEAGASLSAPRVVTPKDGRALAFDLQAGDDGAALVTWRDDDTPSGSSGGRLSLAVVRLGGVGEARPFADEDTGSGVPDLLPGWFAVTSASGRTRLAPMDGKGQVDGPLQTDAVLGGGQLLAATKEALFLARPAGKAMRLGVVRCVKERDADPDAGAATALPGASAAATAASARAAGSDARDARDAGALEPPDDLPDLGGP